MIDKNQVKNRKIDLEDNFEIEELLDIIEDRQNEQAELLRFRADENNDLKFENQRLNSMVSSLQNENEYLKNELEKTRAILINSEQKHRHDMNKKMSEIYTIMEISKKIEDQNREIYELEKETEKQRERFIELESNK